MSDMLNGTMEQWDDGTEIQEKQNSNTKSVVAETVIR